MLTKPAQRVPVRLGPTKNYDIEIGAGALEKLGVAARAALPSTARRVVVVSNPSVFALYGARAVESLRAGEFAVTHWLMGDGERYKTLRTAERALDFLGESRLERSDAVVALGGGWSATWPVSPPPFTCADRLRPGADDITRADRFFGRRKDRGQHAAGEKSDRLLSSTRRGRD